MTSAPIRVLVVDDSLVVRKLVSDALNSDPEIEVVGVAANGRIALGKVASLSPDLITLDIEMPELDGLGTLAELRKTHPRLPVVMFSTLTERGASATLEALSLGADDYVTKPSNTGNFELAQERVREQLIPRVKQLVRRSRPSAVTRPSLAPAQPAARGSAAGAVTSAPSVRVAKDQPIELVAIGCSTGGPNALDAVLPLLPADIGVPLVLVQHMPPMFTRLLAERLDQRCALTVREAAGGEPLRPGELFIAPGDYHMQVVREGAGVGVRLDQGAPENFCRPAVDVLFRSAAQIYGGGVLAVILTGMGQDGLVGCQVLAERDAPVLAQDEATSVVWGMPGHVARAGLASRILPLPEIGPEIARLVARSRSLRRVG